MLASGLDDLPRLSDDLAFAAEIGLQTVRLDMPWVLTQPKAGIVVGGVLESMRETLIHARSLGLDPWVRLLQTDVPQWFDNEGGFSDERTAGLWWPRWVEVAADALGDLVSGWVPFEAPYVMSRRLEPDDPRRHGVLTNTLVVAWRDAWRILRGGPPVATSLDVRTESDRRHDQLRWGVWLGGLRDGMVRIPGRADRSLADLAGACDVVGLALRAEVEAVLHRVADQGPQLPLAITFRPTGTDDTECAASIARMWHGVDAASSRLEVRSVVATPLLDQPEHPDQLGLATANRRLKDAGEAFLRRS